LRQTDAPQRALGLAEAASGGWIQRGLSGSLDIPIERGVPRMGDEIRIRLAITPIGAQPPEVASEGVLVWSDGDAPSSRTQLSFPLVVDGQPTEYLIRLGTSASWLVARNVERLSLRLPRYPLRVRVD
jgi:hypothetical protein